MDLNKNSILEVPILGAQFTLDENCFCKMIILKKLFFISLH